ncbi:MAG: hypothetical protein M3N24_04770 [Actinomycetota bacterium]|nr:hypothetical protein [Actinomycetota bacterium]
MTGWFRQITAEAVIETLFLLAFGYLIADVLVRRRDWDSTWTWALAVPALAGYAFILMLAHILSGGLVLSHAWVVRAITGLVIAVLVARKFVTGHWKLRWEPRQVIPVVVLVSLALLIWGYPIARIVPLGNRGDIRWHLGWASQLLNGETTPNSILSGNIPNYYPWLFHSVVSFVAAFSPGGRAYHALPPLQLVQVSGVVLALFATGKLLGKSWVSGAAAALFGGFASGPLISKFPWLTAAPADLGGRGTFNASFNNIAPPLPRDLGYAMFVSLLLLLLVATQQRSRGLLVSGGALLGLIGLTSWEWFFVGLALAALLVVVPTELGRSTKALALFVPAVTLYATWAVPIAINYADLGGFINTTAREPPALTPLAILLSWGFVAPLAAFAVFRWLPRHRHEPWFPVLVALLASAAAFTFLPSVIPLVLGASFQTLGRASRYWPVFHFSLAVLAGVAAGDVVERISRRHVAPAVAVGAAILGLSIIVPIQQSVGLPERWDPFPGLAAGVLGRPSIYLEAASNGSADCVVAAPRFLQMPIFSFTGYRQQAYRGSDVHAGNYSRIRWRDIYERVPDDRERIADNNVLTMGMGPVEKWRETAQKYGVDMVVVTRPHYRAAVFERLFPGRVAELRRTRPHVALFRVSDCAQR